MITFFSILGAFSEVFFVFGTLRNCWRRRFVWQQHRFNKPRALGGLRLTSYFFFGGCILFLAEEFCLLVCWFCCFCLLYWCFPLFCFTISCKSRWGHFFGKPQTINKPSRFLWVADLYNYWFSPAFTGATVTSPSFPTLRAKPPDASKNSSGCHWRTSLLSTSWLDWALTGCCCTDAALEPEKRRDESVFSSCFLARQGQVCVFLVVWVFLVDFGSILQPKHKNQNHWYHSWSPKINLQQSKTKPTKNWPLTSTYKNTNKNSSSPWISTDCLE